MANINVKTAPSTAFMIISRYTIRNNDFTEINLITLCNRDIISLNYGINNNILIGKSQYDKNAINAAAALINDI